MLADNNNTKASMGELSRTTHEGFVNISQMAGCYSYRLVEGDGGVVGIFGLSLRLVRFEEEHIKLPSALCANTTSPSFFTTYLFLLQESKYQQWRCYSMYSSLYPSSYPMSMQRELHKYNGVSQVDNSSHMYVPSLPSTPSHLYCMPS